MQEAIPTRQEHKNNRYAGVLPRDHDDQKPKKSFVGWDQDSSSAKDQGKNNMATERLTEKSMRKPGEDQSPVVKQEYLSNNVERDINQDDLSSKEKKDGGRSSTPYSDPSKNVVDSVARTNSPLEKEKKGDKISDGGSRGQLHPDPSKIEKIMTATRVGPGVQYSENGEAPTYSSTGPPVVPQTQSHNSANKTVESFPPTIPSYEKEKKGMTAMRTPGNATMLSTEQSKDNAGKIQNTDPPKTTATHVGVQSNNESVSSSRTSTQPHGDQNTTFESIPQTPSFEKSEKKEVESKNTAMTSSKPQSQGENATSFDNPRVLRKNPSKDQKENKDDGRGTQYSNSSSSNANATNHAEADGHYVANKDIGVPLVSTKKVQRNNTSTTGSYEKRKKGGCSCSVL